MQHISFLHCADIHLGHLQYNEPQRLLDFAASFRQVVDYALKHRVDFVLLGGDFFHKRNINAPTLQQAIELLSPLKKAGIPVVAVEGNHDKALYQDKDSWLGFLKNQGYLFLLAPVFQEGKLLLLPWDEETKSGSWLDLGGARIYGTGYLGVTTAARLGEVFAQLPKKSEHFVILLLHAAVNRLLMQDIGGIKSELLRPFREKVDYLALGHIHSRYELEGWIYNPGSLECVHLDEFGPDREKGFYHITVGEGGHEARYIPSEYRPVIQCTVNLSDSASPDYAYEMLYQELAQKEPVPGAQVQVRLVGEVSYNPLGLDLAKLSDQLKDDFSCLYVEIINQVNLPAAGSLEKGMLVKREDVERHVFGELLLQEKKWDTQDLSEAVGVIQKVKEMVLYGEEEDEILNLLAEYGERLLKDDSDYAAETQEVAGEAV